MNGKTPRFGLALLAVAAVVLVAGGVMAAPEKAAKVPTPDGPAAGTVAFREGRAVRYREADGPKELLKKGSEVWAGDTIATLGRAKIEIRMSDGSALRLGPKSEAVIKEADFGSEGTRKVSVGLKLGKAWSKVTGAVTDESKYEITTDNAVAGVRGTTFRVNADKDKSTLVRVYSGTVAVAGVRPIYQTHQPGEKREQVAGPKQITKEEWEKLVGSMMSVRIGANGLPAEPEKFAVADELSSKEKGWIAWNRKRDAAMEKAAGEE